MEVDKIEKVNQFNIYLHESCEPSGYLEASELHVWRGKCTNKRLLSGSPQHFHKLLGELAMQMPGIGKLRSWKRDPFQ